jgi:hypothetical protein
MVTRCTHEALIVSEHETIIGYNKMGCLKSKDAQEQKTG